MPFPVYYNGQILFRNGSPAMSLNCCCDGPPSIPSVCCGTTLEMECEVYDETNTVLLFTETFTWTLEAGWTATPPEDETIETTEVFSVDSGPYRLEQASRPYVRCYRDPLIVGVAMEINISLGVSKDGIGYANPALFHVETCPLGGDFSPWYETPPHRIRARYT